MPAFYQSAGLKSRATYLGSTTLAWDINQKWRFHMIERKIWNPAVAASSIAVHAAYCPDFRLLVEWRHGRNG